MPRLLQQGKACRVRLATFHQSDTKLFVYGPLLESQRDQGRERALAGLNGPSSAVGNRSSIDVEALFG